VRNVTHNQYVQVYASYGIPYPEPAGTYELDHLISLELGGDNSNANYCYYASKEQCMRTMSGIGVFCFESPYYRQSPPQSFEARALCQQQAQASASVPESQDAYFDQCMIHPQQGVGKTAPSHQ
jgi:hypothetical protein